MEEKKNSLTFVVVLEFIIILALIGVLFYTINNDKKQDKCKNEPEVKEPIPEKPSEEKEPAAEEKQPEEKPTENSNNKEKAVVSAFKEYYIKSGLADSANISTWEFTTAKEVTNTKYKGYYEFSGYFICKDKTSDCVYLEQVGDPINGQNAYGFVLFAKVVEKNGNYTFSDLSTSLE